MINSRKRKRLEQRLYLTISVLTFIRWWSQDILLFLFRHPLDFFTRFGRQVDRHEKLGKGYIVESTDFVKGHQGWYTFQHCVAIDTQPDLINQKLLRMAVLIPKLLDS